MSTLMPNNPFDYQGQVVVVTGASRGLGAALAEGFAGQGAHVVIGDVLGDLAEQRAASIRATGGMATAVACDITDPTQVAALQQVAEGLGGASVLVNNAGINRPKPAEELSLAEWSSILGVNLTGTFICCQTFGLAMLARGAGSIINICSVHGHVGSYVHKAAAYNASKAGVVNLTRSLALEWGERGVRVNGISPGPLRTELMATRLANQAYVDRSLDRLAIKRIGEVGDVVGTALFLASPAAAWVTGQIVGVDGGWLAA
jgi:NAD(P)-dependent dehydrogenase (short-subunit alcohol dehydrogenase family)